MTRLCGVCLAGLAALWPGLAPAAEAEAEVPTAEEPAASVNQGIRLTLPKQLSLADLVAVIALQLSVDVDYNPQRLRGDVALRLDASYTRDELWAILNQVLAGQGFTTVIAGEPPIHHVVAFNEAAALSRVQIPGEPDPGGLAPGYRVVIRDLANLGGDQAIELLTPAIGGQTTQLRTLGRGGHRLVLAAPSARIAEADRLLALIDTEGAAPGFAVYAPTNATPQRLQQVLTAAWTAAGRVGGRVDPIDIQMMPDSRRLLLVAPAGALERLTALAARLDAGEPLETRTYPLTTFSAAEVAALLPQVVGGDQATQRLSVATNQLTGGLVITGTALQHQQVTEFLESLDGSEAGVEHRELRRFPVRHRPADAMASVVRELLSAGAGQLLVDDPNTDANSEPAAGAGQSEGSARTRSPAGLHFTIDAPSNTIIGLGAPRQLDEVAEILMLLDQRSPQLQLEVVMVALSTSQSRQLGLELAGQFEEGATEVNLASLFGLGLGSTVPATGGSVDQGAFSGFGGLVLNPGDWAVLVRALEAEDDGRSVVRSQLVVDNGSEANLEAVVQEPLSEVSSNSSSATTGFAGTSDAGTQIVVTPTINAGDHVTIEFSVSQSSFLGEGTQSGSGVTLPPTRRADSLTSVTTIPDGFVVSLGGILSQTETVGESRIPLLGSIPVLGRLFRTESSGSSDTRFYVFVRADIMRHPAFADLKHRAAAPQAAAGVEDDAWPALAPRFIE